VPFDVPSNPGLAFEIPEPTPVRPTPQQAASKGGSEQNTVDRGPSRSQADVPSDSQQATVTRAAPKPAATVRETLPIELVSQPASATLASIDPSGARLADAPSALVGAAFTRILSPLPQDSFGVHGEERQSAMTARPAMPPPVQVQNTDGPVEGPVAPAANDGARIDDRAADSNSSMQPRTLSAAALTNVLAFDVRALESSIDAFFQSIDRVGHTLAENRTNVLYAAGMIGLAAAMAIELSRRKSQSPAPSLVSQRGTGIPFSDYP